MNMEGSSEVAEEKLREFCCDGDVEKARFLLQQGVDVNSSNKINGWTPLHWASKRNHTGIVKLLLANGAKLDSTTKRGETAAQLTKDPSIQQLLSVENTIEPVEDSKLPIVPNYIKFPKFIYGRDAKDWGQVDTVNVAKGGGDGGTPQTLPPKTAISKDNVKEQLCRCCQHQKNIAHLEELVLKVRKRNNNGIIGEKDFIEVELDFGDLSFENLVDVCCRELSVDPHSVTKIRKLPDTIIRKDKDVKRLKQYQELEIVHN
ncbi:ankyrin repeat domain-containing protein 40 [Nematostella vectensis]|uniref:ankyrin repeat domain-containing protein 40 n=1 Tax=Nematostella vectensis TaxID=45351 RepID=UPI0020770C10|nr:ankyrin repeat domain-containing protein 40 [Nematostella vectensis]